MVQLMNYATFMPITNTFGETIAYASKVLNLDWPIAKKSWYQKLLCLIDFCQDSDGNIQGG